MLSAEVATHARTPDIYARNRAFYDSVWKHARVRGPRWWANTWPVVEEVLAANPGRHLEIGPGVRPRLPLNGTCFVDLSGQALTKLGALGARVLLANGAALPFPDAMFQTVCAVDVVEHADEPARILAEVARVVAPGGAVLVAFPLHADRWTELDSLVGHGVRYAPEQVLDILDASRLQIVRSAPFGRVPGNRFLLRVGVWVLERLRGPAVVFEDRLVLPLARLFARRIPWRDGFHVHDRTDGVILLLRKAV